MDKVDHIKELSMFYKQPNNKISVIDLPSLNFLMIDGSKSPNNNPDYADAVAALYAIAYKLKFYIFRKLMQIFQLR